MLPYPASRTWQIVTSPRTNTPPSAHASSPWTPRATHRLRRRPTREQPRSQLWWQTPARAPLRALGETPASAPGRQRRKPNQPPSRRPQQPLRDDDDEDDGDQVEKGCTAPTPHVRRRRRPADAGRSARPSTWWLVVCSRRARARRFCASDRYRVVVLLEGRGALARVGGEGMVSSEWVRYVRIAY